MIDHSARRFTILEHDHPFLHWYLLIQDGNVLTACRLLQRPKAGCWIEAEALPDHRLMYLDYEGPVSNNRGHVVQFTTGVLEPLPALDAGDVQSYNLFDTSFATKAERKVSSAALVEWRFT